MRPLPSLFVPVSGDTRAPGGKDPSEDSANGVGGDVHGAGARVRSGGRESHSELSGTVHGPVVQAGSVHGGIHFGHSGPRPDSPERTPWQLPLS